MISETVRRACRDVARLGLARARAHPLPMMPETILPSITSPGKVGREVADLVAESNAKINRTEVLFWQSMVARYESEGD